MPNYYASNAQVNSREFKTRHLVVPLYITANATPASKTQRNDEPALLFLKTEGIDDITVAKGAMDTSAELSAITFASVTDSTGIFSVCFRCGEQVSKVNYVRLVKRNGNEQVVGTFPTGATTGITSLGDKIVANFDTATDLSSADGNYCLEVCYVVSLA